MTAPNRRLFAASLLRAGASESATVMGGRDDASAEHTAVLAPLRTRPSPRRVPHHAKFFSRRSPCVLKAERQRRIRHAQHRPRRDALHRRRPRLASMGEDRLRPTRGLPRLLAPVQGALSGRPTLGRHESQRTGRLPRADAEPADDGKPQPGNLLRYLRTTPCDLLPPKPDEMVSGTPESTQRDVIRVGRGSSRIRHRRQPRSASEPLPVARQRLGLRRALDLRRATGPAPLKSALPSLQRRHGGARQHVHRAQALRSEYPDEPFPRGSRPRMASMVELNQTSCEAFANR